MLIATRQAILARVVLCAAIIFCLFFFLQKAHWVFNEWPTIRFRIPPGIRITWVAIGSFYVAAGAALAFLLALAGGLGNRRGERRRLSSWIWEVGAIGAALAYFLFAWLDGPWSLVFSAASIPLVLAILCCRHGWHRRPTAWLAHWLTRLRRHEDILFFSVTFLMLSIIAHWTFGAMAYGVDSIAQTFQAIILQSGKFKLQSPPNPDFFRSVHIILDQNGWYSQFPPGHILCLALFGYIFPFWALNPLLGALSVVLIRRLATRIFDPATGTLSALLLMFSPFFMMMQSERMNHGSTMFFALAVTWLVTAPADQWTPGRGLLAGLAAGMALITRPLTGLGLFIPLGLMVLHKNRDMLRAKWRWLVAVALGLAITLAILLVFNWQTTGNPFVMGYQVSPTHGESVGFRGEFTPAWGLSNTINNLNQMNRWLFGLPTGSLTLLALLVLLGRPDRRDGFFFLIFAGLVVAYYFYSYQDNGLGPRFYYESLFCLAILGARALLTLQQALGAMTPGLGHWHARRLMVVIVLGILASGQVFAWNTLARFRFDSDNGFGLLMKLAREYENDPQAVIFVDSLYDPSFVLWNMRYPNGPLFPKDLGNRNEELMRALPDRKFYRMELSTKPEIIPIPMSGDHATTATTP